jgi:Raf kinase inhibitor-like YbhB/YbcL family protein
MQGSNMRKLLNVITAFILLTSVTHACADTSPFTLTSTAAAEQGALPVMYTCDGKNISPKFSWSGVPAHTKSFAMIVSDPDAPNGVFYHWVLYNLPRDIREMAEGVDDFPAGAGVGINSWGKSSYNGPCPPKDTSHHYVFTLYAVNTHLKLTDGVDAPTLLRALKNHVVGTAEFVAVYTRWVA